MPKIFPWQTPLWELLVKRYRENRLAHAFLFAGAEGIGKAHFAQAFAEILLCQTQDLDHACGHCRSCELLKTSLHPDLSYIAGEGKSQTIKIDQIRELNANIIKTAHFGGYRVVIIAAAHQLNQAASNALLKTLEEPPAKVVFILLTDSLYRIPATIRSRCEKINFPKPKFSQIKDWLETHLAAKSTQQYSSEFLFNLAQESPLATLEFAESDDLMWREKLFADFSAVILQQISPLGLAEKYQALGLNKLFFWTKTMVVDVIRLKAGGTAHIVHSDQMDKLQMIGAHLNAAELYAYLDKLYVLGDQIARGMNLNAGLVVDEVFCGMLVKNE